MKQSTNSLITYVRNKDNSLKDETLFNLQSSFCLPSSSQNLAVR